MAVRGPGPGDGRLPVTDLEVLFGTTIEAEDVETVGGLLAHAYGRVPIARASGTVAGLRLTADSLAWPRELDRHGDRGTGRGHLAGARHIR